MSFIFILLVVAVMLLVAVAGVVLKNIYICAPNEVLIFSGSKRQLRDHQVGYRYKKGGLGWRIPLMETVDRLDLTNMIIDIRVQGAYSKGGIPLNVEGVANLKVAGKEPELANAIERLLGKGREDIVRIARETLEGNLRGVLATLTPEEVNQDRIKFAESLLREADKDLINLGLDLDTLKIQNVSDNVGYLDSLGRRQTADLLMRSRIAEAENKALSAERSADNVKTQEIARVNAEIAMARADARRRIIDAQTKKTAMVAEQQSIVTAEVAKARAELDVQRARIEQVRLQLLADRIKPAQAQKHQMIEAARGASAKIIEDGKATAESLRQIATTWAATGDNARQVFVAQKLSGLVSSLMQTVSPLPIDKFTVIDKSLGGGDNLAVKATLTSEQLKHTLGVDIPALLKRLEGRSEEPAAVPPPLPPSRG